jgi:hypothetical protein
MSALFRITSVTGTSPNWTLAVDSASGISIDDHILAELDGHAGVGGEYRVDGIPDSHTINVIDDLLVSPVGKPAVSLKACAWTPTPRFELSQLPDGGLFWGAATRSDLSTIDRHLSRWIGRGMLEFIDPTTNLTAEEVDTNEVVLVEVTVPPTPAAVAKFSCPDGPGLGWDLSAESTWYMSVETEAGVVEFSIDASAFGDPVHVTQAELIPVLDAALPGATPFTFTNVDPLIGMAIQLEHTTVGLAHWVQVGTPVGTPNLNTVLQFDTSRHYGTDDVSLTLALPDPTDVVTFKGARIAIGNRSISAGYFKIQPTTGPELHIQAGTKIDWMWDGVQWIPSA